VVGAWNSHIRIGAAQGTDLEDYNCAVTLSPKGNTCYGAFLSLHITSGASAYIEVCIPPAETHHLAHARHRQGLWAWVGDHDLDGKQELINVYAGRGILSESKGTS
jgi:glucan 1,3-beta-glucosidase